MAKAQHPHIDEVLVRQVAQLAKLELTDAEARAFAPQLESVLGYIENLRAVDVTGVEPMAHPLELTTPLREDVVRPSPRDEEGRPKVLKHAPDVLHDGFKVPPVL